MDFEGSSSSLSKSEPPRWIYDVFINFRGSDTRQKFVSHLYYALSKNAGVKTFLDEADLRKGTKLQELMRTIEGSQIAIVVFSKNYTESTWCLDELEKIIECRETYGQQVVPVFYHIEPSDVRREDGDFRQKMIRAAAEKKIPKELLEHKLSRWSSTLTKAADISGWNVGNFRDDAKLVETIVRDVLSKLDYEVLSNTEVPVGLKSRAEKVIRFIENQSTKVCIIGIWGMGGLGKTTTAKDIYNQIHRRFMGKSSFIESIREFCKTGRGLVGLQEKILLDVLKTKKEIIDVGMGKTEIENRLDGKRALIVLDDVYEFDQLKGLCGGHKRMGQGSVIIITTRNLELLHQFEVDYVYTMEEMDDDESLKLFSWYAFGEAKPSEDFNKLARKAVAYCGGLPLALKVLGEDLNERDDEDLWRSLLSKREIIPNPEVQKILKISYDGCDRMEKNIFLDICCVFIGKDRADVTKILDGCELYPESGILHLQERSLIKVDENNKIRMHQLLRDMGREIIQKLSTDRLGNSSHLWFQKDVLHVLTKHIGTKAIEGLALKFDSTNESCFRTDAFKRMKRLRLLRLAHVQVTGDYKYLSKQLRWISWQGFPLDYIPKDLYLQHVIGIDFEHSKLNQVWQEAKVLQKLKILNLSHSEKLTETPDFSKLPSLEKLILEHCPSLWKIHHTIGDLCNLFLINLKDCTNLSNLPRETYKLKSLKTLILSGCLKIDKLEEDILEMESLTTLITENTVVEQVPFSIVSSKGIGYICLHTHKGLSLDVFHSIIWSWMSPTINPQSRRSMKMKKKHLSELGPILGDLLNLRSVSVQYDKGIQISNPVSTIMDKVHPVNLTELETTPHTSEISKQSLKYDLIGIGSYHEEVFNTLSKSISKRLATMEPCNILFPGDCYRYWFAHMWGEGHSVRFTVPKDCHLKAMIICALYLSTSETRATECLLSVSMVNHTKCTVQIYKRDTVISFNEVDWQCITSHMGSGDLVEIFVNFRHELVVKKTVVYLFRDESSDMEIELASRPPIKKVYSRKRKRMATEY